MTDITYTISRTSITGGGFPLQLPPGALNQSVSPLSLVGRGYIIYGQLLQNDFVHMLENFAAPTPPTPSPLSGQFWYNTANDTMNYLSLSGIWKPIGSLTSSSSGPSAPNPGDLWYDPSNNTLYFWNGTGWTPIANAFTGAQYMNNNGHDFIAMVVDGNIVSTFSTSTFTPSPAIPGFPTIDAGFTMSNNGTYSGMNSGTILPLANATYNLGSSGDQWNNIYGVNGIFSGSLTVDGPIVAPGGYQNILPETTNTYSIGSPSDIWANGYFAALTVSGPASFAGNLLPTVDNTYVVGNSSLRWESGYFSQGLIVDGSTGPANPVFKATNSGGSFNGTWTLDSGASLQATYSDLAERYEADVDMDVGTLVAIGGLKDVTMSSGDCSMDVFGIVSEAAGLKMNAKLGESEYEVPEASRPRFPYIAQTGTVPVKVLGRVKKGERLVSSEVPGVARAISNTDLVALGGKASFVVIGRATRAKTTEGIGLLDRVAVNVSI